MTAIQDGLAIAATDATAPSSDMPAAPSSRWGAWKLLAWAVLWVALANLGALIAGFGVGLALYFTEDGYVDEALQDVDIGGSALALTNGILLLLLAWFGLRSARKAGNGDLRAGLHYLPIQKPRQIALITGILLLYGLVLPFVSPLPYPDLPGKMREANPLLLLVGALLVGILAPIAEELFFRGWLWTALQRYWSEPVTAFVTGAFWYAIHYSHGLLYMAMLLPAAGLVTLVRHVGGSVRASILVHMIYNLYCVACWLVLAFIVKL